MKISLGADFSGKLKNMQITVHQQVEALRKLGPCGKIAKMGNIISQIG